MLRAKTDTLRIEIYCDQSSNWHYFFINSQVSKHI